MLKNLLCFRHGILKPVKRWVHSAPKNTQKKTWERPLMEGAGGGSLNWCRAVFLDTSCDAATELGALGGLTLQRKIGKCKRHRCDIPTSRGVSRQDHD
jgi:hypothetical protein